MVKLTPNSDTLYSEMLPKDSKTITSIPIDKKKYMVKIDLQS